MSSDMDGPAVRPELTEFERTAAFEQDWQRWHAARERSLASAYGWLSLTAFVWLSEDPGPVADLPGRWGVRAGAAVLTATARDGLRLVRPDDADADDGDGDGPIDGTVTARLDDEISLDWVRHGDRLVELAGRGGRYAVRVRDPRASTLRSFTGVAHFPVDPAWVRAGRFEPSDRAHQVWIGTARSDLTGSASVLGTVWVRIDAAEYPLAAAPGGAGTLTLTFYDATNGDSTASWRFVSTSRPAADGSLQIDFNRALNYPSAFTQFGTCPAPLRGNTLPIPVTAGERRAR